MRARALLALGAIGAFVAGALLLHPASVHPRAADTAAPSGVSSGSWFCPHGGGAGWTARLSLANPGDSAVQARVTELGAKGEKPPRSVSVPAQSVLRLTIDATSPQSAAEVEYFDGWIGASWTTVAGGKQSGLAAEQCEPALSRSWIVPDGTTLRGEDGWVVVMNPTAADAIFGISLLTETAVTAPGAWSDVVLPAGRSAAFQLSKFRLGKRTVSAMVDAKIGRVAVAGFGVTSSGGIRAADGLPLPVHASTLPGGPDSGRTELVVANPSGGKASYRGTLLRTDGSQPIGQLNGETLPSQQARTYELSTSPASSIQFTVSSSAGVAVARRTFGPHGDQGSTVGAQPAAAWVIQAGTAAPSGKWAVSFANPGTAPVEVRLSLVDGGGPVSKPPPMTVTIPAGRTTLVGPGFTRGAPQGAIVAIASSGTFVPLATSFTSDERSYAVSMGEPIPAHWVPAAS